MGRPPSNGAPSFRFNPAEIGEMEAMLQAHKMAMPEREVLVSLAEKFSNTEERKGKIEVQMKQVWNWFQNRRYAIRAKAAKSPGRFTVTQTTKDDSGVVKGVPQATQPDVASAVGTFPQAPQHPPAFTVQSAGRVTDNSQMEYEAKSARDGAWYDVSSFLSHRLLEAGNPEVMVRFAGFGAEEDEWVNVLKNVRQRSLPCESSECVVVLPADLILCFLEGKDQALYFDAHVLDAQRRRHDVRGCRCRFLVRYDHDQSEEIVALRKICRRPETDYRLQQLHALNESLSATIHTGSTLRVYPPAGIQQLKQPVVSSPPEGSQKRQKVESTIPAVPILSSEVPGQQKVETGLPDPDPDPSARRSDLTEKPESTVYVSSGENSADLQRSDEVPHELQKVQPVKPDPPVERHKLETAITSSGEVSEQAPPSFEVSVSSAGAVPSKIPEETLHNGKSEEAVVRGSDLVKVPTELHGVQLAVPDQPVVESPTGAAPSELPEETPHNDKPEEFVVLGSDSAKVPTELHDVQLALPSPIGVDPSEIPEETLDKLEESVVLGSDSVKVPTELHDVQLAVPIQPVVEAIETKTEELVVEAMETKMEELMVAVSTGGTNVVEEAMNMEAVDPVVVVSTSSGDVAMVEEAVEITGEGGVSGTVDKKGENVEEKIRDHNSENDGGIDMEDG